MDFWRKEMADEDWLRVKRTPFDVCFVHEGIRFAFLLYENPMVKVALCRLCYECVPLTFEQFGGHLKRHHGWKSFDAKQHLPLALFSKLVTRVTDGDILNIMLDPCDGDIKEGRKCTFCSTIWSATNNASVGKRHAKFHNIGPEGYGMYNKTKVETCSVQTIRYKSLRLVNKDRSNIERRSGIGPLNGLNLDNLPTPLTTKFISPLVEIIDKGLYKDRLVSYVPNFVSPNGYIDMIWELNWYKKVTNGELEVMWQRRNRDVNSTHIDWKKELKPKCVALLQTASTLTADISLSTRALMSNISKRLNTDDYTRDSSTEFIGNTSDSGEPRVNDVQYAGRMLRSLAASTDFAYGATLAEFAGFLIDTGTIIMLPDADFGDVVHKILLQLYYEKEPPSGEFSRIQSYLMHMNLMGSEDDIKFGGLDGITTRCAALLRGMRIVLIYAHQRGDQLIPADFNQDCWNLKDLASTIKLVQNHKPTINQTASRLSKENILAKNIMWDGIVVGIDQISNLYVKVRQQLTASLSGLLPVLLPMLDNVSKNDGSFVMQDNGAGHPLDFTYLGQSSELLLQQLNTVTDNRASILKLVDDVNDFTLKLLLCNHLVTGAVSRFDEMMRSSLTERGGKRLTWSHPDRIRIFMLQEVVKHFWRGKIAEYPTLLDLPMGRITLIVMKLVRPWAASQLKNIGAALTPDQEFTIQNSMTMLLNQVGGEPRIDSGSSISKYMEKTLSDHFGVSISFQNLRTIMSNTVPYLDPDNVTSKLNTEFADAEENGRHSATAHHLFYLANKTGLSGYTVPVRVITQLWINSNDYHQMLGTGIDVSQSCYARPELTTQERVDWEYVCRRALSMSLHGADLDPSSLMSSEWRIPEQGAAIQEIYLNERSVLAVLGCGSGKSQLLYVPLIADLISSRKPGVTILIAPTRVIINEHVRKLRELGISVTDIGRDRYDAFDFIGDVMVYAMCFESFDNFLPTLRRLHSLGLLTRFILDELQTMLNSDADHRVGLKLLKSLREFKEPKIALSGTLATAMQNVYVNLSEVDGARVRVLRTDCLNRNIKDYIYFLKDDFSPFEWIKTLTEEFCPEPERKVIIMVLTKQLGKDLKILMIQGGIAEEDILVYTSETRDYEGADICEWSTGKIKFLICTTLAATGTNCTACDLAVTFGGFDLGLHNQFRARPGRMLDSKGVCVLLVNSVNNWTNNRVTGYIGEPRYDENAAKIAAHFTREQFASIREYVLPEGLLEYAVHNDCLARFQAHKMGDPNPNPCMPHHRCGNCLPIGRLSEMECPLAKDLIKSDLLAFHEKRCGKKRRLDIPQNGDSIAIAGSVACLQLSPAQAIKQQEVEMIQNVEWMLLGLLSKGCPTCGRRDCKGSYDMTSNSRGNCLGIIADVYGKDIGDKEMAKYRDSKTTHNSCFQAHAKNSCPLWKVNIATQAVGCSNCFLQHRHFTNELLETDAQLSGKRCSDKFEDRIRNVFLHCFYDKALNSALCEKLPALRSQNNVNDWFKWLFDVNSRFEGVENSIVFFNCYLNIGNHLEVYKGRIAGSDQPRN